jgi:hypothetical protein
VFFFFVSCSFGFFFSQSNYCEPVVGSNACFVVVVVDVVVICDSIFVVVVVGTDCVVV